MFDASAYELAELDEITATDAGGLAAGCPAANDGAAMLPLPDPATLTLAACATCHNALGECAVQAARAGAMSPVMALAICNSMHRVVERAFAAPVTSMAGYVAFVLLGSPRSEVSRRGDVEVLAETMR